MYLVKKPSELTDVLAPCRRDHRPVALVPTMGYFHAGHLRLMEEAANEAGKYGGLAVVSLFVNPTQFGAGEDLERYPRDLDRDAALAASCGVGVLFAPGAADMYPEGRATWVEVPDLSERLCGRSRPGHFRGVATVVAKLFNLVRPAWAYFGAKDYQQTLVIRRLTADLNFPVEIRVMPTVREEDGLAMSSRNVYLSDQERQAAALIPRALAEGKRVWERGGDPREIRAAAAGVLAGSPLLRPDYVAVVDPDSLADLEKRQTSVLLALAVFAGKTRLIDNILLV